MSVVDICSTITDYMGEDGFDTPVWGESQTEVFRKILRYIEH